MEVKSTIEAIACKKHIEDETIKEYINHFPIELQKEIRLLCKQCFLRGFVNGVEETLRWKTDINF